MPDEVQDLRPNFDPLLVTLVKGANEGRFSDGLPMTFTVAGGTVTGRLIGYREYFTLLEFTDEELDTMSASDDANALPRHVHMKNARFLNGDQLVPLDEGTLWRGRISEVSSFAIGELVATRV